MTFGTALVLRHVNHIQALYSPIIFLPHTAKMQVLGIRDLALIRDDLDVGRL